MSVDIITEEAILLSLDKEWVSNKQTKKQKKKKEEKKERQKKVDEQDVTIIRYHMQCWMYSMRSHFPNTARSGHTPK